jgi:hypothetical protein
MVVNSRRPARGGRCMSAWPQADRSRSCGEVKRLTKNLLDFFLQPIGGIA